MKAAIWARKGVHGLKSQRSFGFGNSLEHQLQKPSSFQARCSSNGTPLKDESKPNGSNGSEFKKSFGALHNLAAKTTQQATAPPAPPRTPLAPKPSIFGTPPSNMKLNNNSIAFSSPNKIPLRQNGSPAAPSSSIPPRPPTGTSLPGRTNPPPSFSPTKPTLSLSPRTASPPQLLKQKPTGPQKFNKSENEEDDAIDKVDTQDLEEVPPVVAKVGPKGAVVEEDEEEANKRKIGSQSKAFKDQLKWEKKYSAGSAGHDSKSHKKHKMGRSGGFEDEEDFTIMRHADRSLFKREYVHKKKEVLIPEFLTVAELAFRMGAKKEDLLPSVRALLDEAANLDTKITADFAELLCLEHEHPFKRLQPFDDPQPTSHDDPETDPKATPRPPIVTVMGHVDHGKTTLLDALRSTSVAANEAGGITQAIGAFSVILPSGRAITFIDTPGHEAFTSMRAAGAQVTDVVVLVVAADDGVQNQTIEAIKHAQAAKVPVIVAINKIDKPGATQDEIVNQLLKYEIVPEHLGGDVQLVPVSGLKKMGLDKLEECILLQSDLLDLKASHTARVEATVLEARMDKGLGHVCTAIVQRGTLKPGQFVVAGRTWGRVRLLRDENGKQVKEAKPGQPIEIVGMRGIAEAGDSLLEVEHEDRAKAVSEYRLNKISQEEVTKQSAAIAVMREAYAEQRSAEKEAERESKENKRRLFFQSKQQSENGSSSENASSPSKQTTNDQQPGKRSLFKKTEEEKEKTTEEVKGNGPMVAPVIVKADVAGSVDAIEHMIAQLPSKKVQVRLLSSAVGPVSENDVEAAEVQNAIILSFNVKVPSAISHAARMKKVKLKSQKIIYHLMDDLTKHLNDMLPTKTVESVQGRAECMQVFTIKSKKGEPEQIAGCKVTEGVIPRNSSLVRIIRNGEVVFQGSKISSLKRHKDDVEEVKKGLECGINVGGFPHIQSGDVITCFSTEEVRQTIDEDGEE